MLLPHHSRELINEELKGPLDMESVGRLVRLLAASLPEIAAEYADRVLAGLRAIEMASVARVVEQEMEELGRRSEALYAHEGYDHMHMLPLPILANLVILRDRIESHITLLAAYRMPKYEDFVDVLNLARSLDGDIWDVTFMISPWKCQQPSSTVSWSSAQLSSAVSSEECDWWREALRVYCVRNLAENAVGNESATNRMLSIALRCDSVPDSFLNTLPEEIRSRYKRGRNWF